MFSKHRRDRFDDVCFVCCLTAGEEARAQGLHAVRALGALDNREHDQPPPDPPRVCCRSAAHADVERGGKTSRTGFMTRLTFDRDADDDDESDSQYTHRCT